MKCKKCNNKMQTDVEEEKYICKCGYEIKWGGKIEENDIRY